MDTRWLYSDGHENMLLRLQGGVKRSPISPVRRAIRLPRALTSPAVPFTPYDAATHAIRRSRRLLDSARPGGSAKLPAIVRGDMRRLSIVMAVAALDTYMHRLIVERAYQHGEQLPGALARLDVPFAELLAQADATKTAASAASHKTRPRVAIKRLLRDRLLRETFQRYEDIGRALGMVGRSGLLPTIGQQMSPPLLPKEIRDRLNGIVTRRNQIVHEGDYRRLERPRDAARNAIRHSQARLDINFIADLINAIHTIV